MRAPKWAVLPFIVACFSVQAQFDRILIENFQGNYNNPSGTASASRWLTTTNDLTNTMFQVDREETQMRFSYDGGEVLVENLPEAIVNAESASASGIQLNARGSQVDFSLARLRANNPSQSISVRNFSASCSKSSAYTEEFEKYLDACTTNSTLRGASISITDNSPFMSMVNEVKSLFNIKNNKNTTDIETISLDVNNNKFNFSLRVGLTVRGNGSITYRKSNGKNVVRLKVDRVRSGFFTVTDTFFNAIDDISVDGIVVEKPYITISF